ncbi:tyrosine-protein phosphatase [Yersinia similis]|uniref:C4-dicarboxylate ABC transporter n=1 Tax=Yersinia similis TaxID=367190 RepID=A0A0T9PXZ4_9GAMM|nr:tyrosine-protein phosphatase [Yersinia similis]AHK19485.1 C4-dicarboxylate ABC transporter [Yersinia similis]CFQ55248.1 protein tyrosine/serine phosphatase [Yersinia similis]CNE74267.1 protein tyrosine/serine phosphatase [Yersinia similis]CNF79732.1 protein tyrosine/serine phosphatase [Yersinia similis]CNH87011.1 protein tyrosine/serine phosphatase [Yersinia similis]
MATFAHPSLIPLDGGINFRDLGSNLAADGRRIKPGLLFRSGSLDRLSTNDCDFLSNGGVTQIIDYRDTDEVLAKPDVLWPGAHYHNIPANPLSSEVNANLEKLTNETLAAFDARAFMFELYHRLPFNNLAYQQLVNLLQNCASTDHVASGVVQHCAVGKDRTGVGAALVLFALGADESTVLEDYLLTEATLKPFREHMLAELALKLNDQALEQFAFVLSAREEFIQTALRSIHDRYGSRERWLKHEFGLGSIEREKLQSYFLE